MVIPAYSEEALPALHRAPRRVPRRRGPATDADLSILVVDDDKPIPAAADILRTSRRRARRSAPPGSASSSFTRNFGHWAAVVRRHAARLWAPTSTSSSPWTPTASTPSRSSRNSSRTGRRARRAVHAAPARQADRLDEARSPTPATFWLLGAHLRARQAWAPGMADFKLWDGDLLLADPATALPQLRLHARASRRPARAAAPVVPCVQNVVEGRSSRFTSRKMWSLAAGAIVRYSDVPLRFSILVGLVALLFAATLTAYVLWATFTGRTVRRLERKHHHGSAPSSAPSSRSRSASSASTSAAQLVPPVAPEVRGEPEASLMGAGPPNPRPRPCDRRGGAFGRGPCPLVTNGHDAWPRRASPLRVGRAPHRAARRAGAPSC